MIVEYTSFSLLHNIFNIKKGLMINTTHWHDIFQGSTIALVIRNMFSLDSGGAGNYLYEFTIQETKQLS